MEKPILLMDMEYVYDHPNDDDGEDQPESIRRLREWYRKDAKGFLKEYVALQREFTHKQKTDEEVGTWDERAKARLVDALQRFRVEIGLVARSRTEKSS